MSLTACSTGYRQGVVPCRLTNGHEHGTLDLALVINAQANRQIRYGVVLYLHRGDLCSPEKHPAGNRWFS